MKRLVTPLALLAALALAMSPAPALAQTLIFDYVGFDYESPDLAPGFGEIGAGYVGLGVVPSVFAPLVSDTSLNQYTYVVSGMTVTNVQAVGSFLVISYSPGTITLYEDAKLGGTAADFAPNPPNAIAPGSFTDGTLYLSGTLTGFQFVVNTVNGSGSYEAACLFDGGANLSDIPPSDRNGWTFAGSTSNALNIPPGYAHQIDGQNFITIPTSAAAGSWGALKRRYR